ncbi:MAG TPA: oxygenase MpaB family protein [Mycobacteriales bacterium]|nr:oxygenase MpaB family protein [Mycobacteriales bacterium]HWA65382.1 oxygenase MpaB family protein [Mycobacteriales bacterium]
MTATTESTTSLEGFDIRRYLVGIGGDLPGPANVIMQLSWPEIGYGVMESRVESGSAMKHPYKRARTTFTYLSVAMLGNDDDRRNFAKAVNGQHAQVRSTEESPVSYNALNPELQLWVAACLYYGTLDLYERMHGPINDEAESDRFYAYCARFGTTLQVRESMWPKDRAAFAEYWEAGVKRANIDDAMRRYLHSLTLMENLPKAVQRLGAERSLFYTKGFLPPLFREQMGYAWSDDDEDLFTKKLQRLGRMDRRLPTSVKVFPFSALLWDMRRRQRKGSPLV